MQLIYENFPKTMLRTFCVETRVKLVYKVNRCKCSPWTNSNLLLNNCLNLISVCIDNLPETIKLARNNIIGVDQLITWIAMHEADKRASKRANKRICFYFI